MPYAENQDDGLSYLLELHGLIQVLSEEGHWAKFEVIRVAATSWRPHGIKYSLTLHARDGTRLLGFDNAHALKFARPGSRACAVQGPYDHCHRRAGDMGVAYEFRNAWQLLQDFYREVDRILKEESP